MKLDVSDPLLRHNLNRLEKRFKQRYYSSFQKDVKRRSKGKTSHNTTLKSIEDNFNRFQEVRRLKHLLLGDPLNLDLKSKVKKKRTTYKNVK